MARILNVIIVILECIGLYLSISKSGSFKKLLIYYTQLSNLLTLCSSLLFVIFGPKDLVEIVRYVSVCMMIMTLLVTVFVLVPMSGKVEELLFSGSGLYYHLIIPILTTITFLFVEEEVSYAFVWITPVLTLIYGIIMLIMNYKEKLEGPYPFFKIRKQGVKATIIWMAVLMVVISTISALVLI
ncbi:MAG: hypothetical protein K6G87_10470 [Butyrivibrio sp.]|uniref:hypothetical protein n=1 Tax=Butyrivibrio sp. TaxID=28121 RepID=UPI0025CC19A5|nr:hypothetical protein [Butyrivibrio sp.]MCR5771640.1 hypothetical protein [Butyrivibrio sp.]